MDVGHLPADLSRADPGPAGRGDRHRASLLCREPKRHEPSAPGPDQQGRAPADPVRHRRAWATSACRWRWSWPGPATGCWASTSTREWSTGSTPAARTSRTSPTRSSRTPWRAAVQRDHRHERGCREPDAISICVPTPLSKFKDPDVSYIVAATEAVKQRLRRGRPSSWRAPPIPGTTREILLPALESTGLRVGEDFFLAFSPERVDPGNPRSATRNTPKVVGGITADCRAVAWRSTSRPSTRWCRSPPPRRRSWSKLLENTFRSVNIGLVNEMAIVCDKLGVDVWEVIDAAATKPFGFMKFLPGPGLGGHCIPIDPHYLAWKMRGLNYKTRFIDLAGELNTEMPLFWVRKAGRGAQLARGRRCGGPRCWCWASPTSGTSTTSGRVRRSTSSGCSKGRGRGSATTTRTCPLPRGRARVPVGGAHPGGGGGGRLRHGRHRPHRRSTTA